VIGGGVAGLTAAITASRDAIASNSKIVVLEASSTWGGRVQSDVRPDGYVLDRGFAVFIEEYPLAKQLLDYEALKLGRFLPGALVKIQDETRLARVADPLRDPGDIFNALLAPIGTLEDKIDVVPLVLHVKSKTLEELFEEPERDTLTELKERWGFSNQIIDSFFRPFLEGIYLAPLEEQSSRMFSFVFKMFSDGYATLPEGGIGAVAQQLATTALDSGVALRSEMPVSNIIAEDKGTFIVETKDGKTRIRSNSVILATDGHIAQRIMSKVDGFEFLKDATEQPQRKVGCLYYGFDKTSPVEEPVLILNGVADRGTETNPANNVCFPSIVSKGYAPEGSNLCSVTVLGKAMEIFHGREEELDEAVRKQLSTWFPDIAKDILNDWKLLNIYSITNAQPGQFNGPAPANVNGGRNCSTFRGLLLPPGLFVCGDHMATATLNGALESGVNAGKAAAQAVNK
jgi:phytoene dehydrogenase-like protein